MTDTPAAERAPLTIVTAYFALPRNSRAVSDYHAWMANLLPFVTWPLVIFCDEQSLGIIKLLRGNKPAAYRVTRLRDFCIYRHRDAIRAHAMQRLGRPAGQTIGIDAALVWHEKANFVRRAIDDNPYQSEMFFWCDIGLLRRGVFRPSAGREWPNLQICREQFAARPVFFGRPVAPPPPPQKSVWITAEFWGGAAEPTRRFCDAYYRLLDSRIASHRAAADGEPAPRDCAYHTEELLFTAMAASGDCGMRVVTKDDLRWPRWLKALGQIRRMPGIDWFRRRRHNAPAKTAPSQIGAGNTFISLYLLNGARFPWSVISREIRLRKVLRLLAGRIFR